MLVITRTHEVVVREEPRFAFDARSAWPYGPVRDVSLSARGHGNGRLVRRTGPDPSQALSLFVDARCPRPAARSFRMVKTQSAM
jgi:hypothetical protein